MKALDTSKKTTGKAKEIKDAGFEAVGVYLRSDRCSLPMINDLHNAGLKVFSVYEKGHPDHDEYFSAAQGAVDGTRAADFAVEIGQTEGSQIYAAVDYDPDDSNPAGPTINGRISDYMRAFQKAVKAKGYAASVYGSGRTCRILIANGLAKTGWLAVSKGFAEYKKFKPSASIVQTSVIDDDKDGDTIADADVAGLW